MKNKLLTTMFAVACVTSMTYAQTRQVTGKVTAADGSPLSGASVTVVGSTTATQTDASGNFSLNVSPGASIHVSILGYTAQTVNVGNTSVITVVLQSTEQDLDEVVVVGYGTVKKSDFTGSATQIGAKEIDKRPISNVLQALQGAGPGIQSATPSGAPGSSPSIQIRGIGSYSASSNALIVVDGVPFEGGMANINPSDVESVTVLKDAATIAIYGSRGANGVVMVTTKKGKQGTSDFNAQVMMGVNQNGVPNYETLSAGEYYEIMWQALSNSYISASPSVSTDIARQLASGLMPRNSAGNQVYDGRTYDDIVQKLGNYNAFNVANNQLIDVNGKLNPNAKLKYTDFKTWEDEATRNGKRNEYTINYSKGFNKTDIYSSLSYLDEDGWGLRSSMQRVQGRINVNTEVNKWLKTGLNLSGASNSYDYAATGSGAINNPFYFSRAIAPIYPVYLRDPSTGNLVYDELGNIRYDYGNHHAEFGIARPFNGGRHAIAETVKNISSANRDFLSARAYVDINILPWLTFSTSFSPDIQSVREQGYENTEVGDGAPSGRFNQTWYRQVNYTANQLFRTNNSFGNHNLETVLGHEFFSYKYDDIYGMRNTQGFQGLYVFSNFTNIASLTSSLTEGTIESYFARANYNYDSKYYLSATFRRDGNSKFPADLRWANFWSLGAAWRLDKEAFFQNDHIDMLKLRASYGQMGNSDVGSYYPYQPGYSIGYNNGAAAGAILTSLGSNTLTWETQKPFDVGVDFSLLKGRLYGTFDYYYRNSDGLLFDVLQPYHNGGTTSGSFSISKNVGAMTNQGIELTLTGNLIRKQDFKWDLTLNVTTIKNKLTRMPEETPELTSSPYKRVVGKSIYEYYTRTYYGVDPETGKALYLGLADGVNYDPTNASYKLIDKGNGKIDTVTFDHNAARQDWIGKSALAPVFGSIVNNFSYKGFDIGFVLTYSLGGYRYDSQYAGLMSSGTNSGSNLHKDLYKAWQKPGDITDVPINDLNRINQNGATSDRWLRKGSYLNISAINFSYRLPVTMLDQIGVKRARVFASAENLYFFSGKKGFNPIGSIAGVTANSSYTHARTVSFGVNFGF